MEDQLQFLVQQLLSGNPTIEHRHPQNSFAIKDRNGDLGAQEFELLLRLDIVTSLITGTAKNPSKTEQLTADPGVEGEFKVLQQARRKAKSARHMEAAAFGDSRSVTK